MISIGAIKLGLAIYRRLKNAEDREEVFKTLSKAIGSDGKLTIIEWSAIGKRLGVFDAK